VGSVVVGVFNQRPVFLRDIARIEDGPEEPADYVLMGHGMAVGSNPAPPVSPAVTITVSKRKGTNAIQIAEKVIHKVNP